MAPIDILLVILVLVLCMCIAWKIGLLGVAGAVIPRAGRTGGSESDPLPEAMSLLDRYESDPDKTAADAATLSADVIPSRGTKLTVALLDAIQYHWLYNRDPTNVARQAGTAALATLRSTLTRAQITALTITKSPSETTRKVTPPSAAAYFRESEMRRLAPAEPVDATALTRKNIDASALARAAEAKLHETETTLRTTEADLRAARDDIRRLKDGQGSIGSLSATTFLAECNADRKILQERVYELRQEIATTLAKCASSNMTPQLQATVNDLRSRNAQLESQLANAMRAPSGPSQSEINAVHTELANCRSLLNDVLNQV